MVDAFNSWLKEHPLQDGVIFLVLSIVFGRYGFPALAVFWKLFKIPPQRLNVWVLKARLSALEAKRARLFLAHNDEKYLILQCTRALVLVVCSSFLLALPCFMFLADAIEKVRHQLTTTPEAHWVLSVVMFLLGYLFSIYAVGILFEINAAVVGLESTLTRLSFKIDRIKQKLRLREADYSTN